LAVVFHRLLSVEEGIGRIAEALGGLKPLGVEEVDLEEAAGRILAETIYSKADSPPFDRSEVDGYAVDSRSLAGADEDNPVRLKVVGRVEVGQKPGVEVRLNEAVEVATGAPLPKGADSVVMVEYTKRDGDYILVYRSTAPSENVGEAGADLTVGDIVLHQGTLLTPREIAVLIVSGYSKVKVYRRPSVSIFSTGDELQPPGTNLMYGKVYDVNGFTLKALVEESGGSAKYLGILGDRFEEVKGAVASALRESDIIITSGSTSAGLGDIIYRVVDELGKPGLLVHGLRIKPGKPTVAGVVDGKIFIGLPGFPLSAMIAFYVFARPIIQKLAGFRGEVESIQRAHLPYRVPAGRGKREYVPVHLVSSPSGLVAYPVLGSPGAASALSFADGFIEVGEDREFLDEGEVVDVHLLSQRVKPVDLVIIGSHCPGVSLITEIAGLSAKIVNVGSLMGWFAVKRGEADIAGTHLLHEQTLKYNTPFIEVYGLQKSAVLIRGYSRMQGFIVKKGNPKNIRSFKDLLRDDVVFINRNKGSGTRVLIDHNLSTLIPLSEAVLRIRGYTREAKTHSAVAAAVAQGRADVGVGVEAWASAYDLDFIPLAEERFDFLIPVEKLSRVAVQRFIYTLSSKRFAEELTRRLKGYSVGGDVGSVLYKPS
jgi:putative molybdopterin biosynthesis protein